MNNQIDSITLISASKTLFNWNSIIALLFAFLTGKRFIFTYVTFYFHHNREATHSLQSYSVYKLHRIVEWLGLEGVLKIIPFQPPKAGIPSARSGFSKAIQPSHEHFNGCGTQSFSWQPFPVPQHPLSRFSSWHLI